MDTLPKPSVPLSCALAGLDFGPSLRDGLEWAAMLGFEAVQIDATSRATRPRDMDRSARRDLGATIRRLELTVSGVDLWIPPAHYTDPERSDRAMSALSDALGFAAELAELTRGRSVVSTLLPDGEAGDAALEAVAALAVKRGASVADHRWPLSTSALVDGGAFSIGVDPASIMLGGGTPEDAEKTILREGRRVGSIRLSDLSSAGRVEPGRGRLDLMGYVAAVAVSGHPGHLVVDLRGVNDQQRAAASVIARCGRRRGS